MELWLQSLALAPKSKKLHIRGLLNNLWDYAMWRGDIPTARNPMELAGASSRVLSCRNASVVCAFAWPNHVTEFLNPSFLEQSSSAMLAG